MSAGLLRLLRGTAYILLLGGGILLLHLFLLWYRYYDTLPRSPQPAVGEIYVMNMHGVAVYATRKERDRLDLAENASFVLLAAGFVACILTSEDYWRKMGWHYPDDSHARPPGSSNPPAG